jgi:hypothetical protein
VAWEREIGEMISRIYFSLWFIIRDASWAISILGFVWSFTFFLVYGVTWLFSGEWDSSIQISYVFVAAICSSGLGAISERILKDRDEFTPDKEKEIIRQAVEEMSEEEQDLATLSAMAFGEKPRKDPGWPLPAAIMAISCAASYAVVGATWFFPVGMGIGIVISSAVKHVFGYR